MGSNGARKAMWTSATINPKFRSFRRRTSPNASGKQNAYARKGEKARIIDMPLGIQVSISEFEWGWKSSIGHAGIISMP